MFTAVEKMLHSYLLSLSHLNEKAEFVLHKNENGCVRGPNVFSEI